MTGRPILVTGASIAGNALALCLARLGFDVTLVERAPAFRDGGQNVDIRGVGRDVMRRLGLERAALDLNTGEQGTAFVDERGRAVATFAVGAGHDGPTAEMEILRGDLARLLHDAARDRATVRFGDSVAAIAPDRDGVSVTFAGGTTGRYGLVVSAEGVGSTTRELVFPGENRPRPMNMVTAYMTIPRRPDDDRLWRWFHAAGGRGVSLRPDNHGTTRAFLTIQNPPPGAQDWPAAQQKAWLRARFADAGWQAPRILAALDTTDDFYFDVLRQTRLPRWSRGRVALTGDAAWCVTPLGGRGATLAVTGAYVLANELARAAPDDLPTALAAYERIMRPLVDRAQGVPAWVPRLFHPRTRTGTRLLRAGLRVAGSPATRAVLARLPSGRRREGELPVYDALPQ